MRQILLVAMMAAATAMAGVARADDESLEDNLCIACHGNTDLWEGDTLHLLVTADDLAGDIHWQKGIRCQDCHGGNAESFDLREAHAIEDGFRKIETPAEMPNFCGHCHSDAAYMKRFQEEPVTSTVDVFLKSVHGQRIQDQESGETLAATCTACHPSHSMRPADDLASAVHPRNLLQTCGQCHQDQQIAMRKGVHQSAGERDDMDGATPLECSKCHVGDPHAMLPVTDSQSPVFLDHQVKVCGDCHKEYLATYEASVHGLGLNKSGLLVTAACADCHGAHDVYYAADKRSTLHSTNVATTCGQCHHFIDERLRQSVHGRDEGPGRATDTAAPGGVRRRRPSCTDCHRRHDQARPDSTGFRQQLPNRCGNCHVDLAVRYGASLHGQLTRLGYEPAAKCSDCHGAHDILPVLDPDSRLAAGAHRAQTCRTCHPNAVANFCNFDPHANHEDAKAYPVLHDTYSWIEFAMFVCFAFFAIHASLWFIRSLIRALGSGPHRVLGTGATAVERFASIHRVLYAVLILCVLGLVFTGLPLKYAGHGWANRLAEGLGGFDTTSVLHHTFAGVAIGCCLWHVCWIVKRIFQRRQGGADWKTIFFGPDSPIPVARDLVDLAKMVRWFFGLGPKPGFERWTYWEKFDYWAVYLLMAVVGLSGLVLWFPNSFTWVLPGGTLNLAHAVHSGVALTSVGVLLFIHLFNTHLRPEKFPLDSSVFSGLVDEPHLREARPEFLDRMAREGRLDELRRPTPPRLQSWLIRCGGYLLIVLCVAVLAVVLLAKLGK